MLRERESFIFLAILNQKKKNWYLFIIIKKMDDIDLDDEESEEEV